MIFAWNTGRLYTDHGQRIAVSIEPGPETEYGREWDATFYDVDRMVSGKCVLMSYHGQEPSKYDVKNDLMRNYDCGHYDHAFFDTELMKRLEERALEIESIKGDNAR